MMKNKSRKKDNFWRIYSVFCAVLAVIIVSVTLFLYDYIKVFEESQPECAVREYIDSITASDIAQLIDVDFSGFEKNVAALEVAERILSENEITYVEVISESAENIFDVYCGEKIMTLMLRKSADLKYGFKDYVISEREVYDEFLGAHLSTITALIPETATLYVNDIEVPGTYRTGEKITDTTVSEFERDESFKLSLISYEIADVFGDYTVKAIDKNGEVILNNPSSGVYTSVSEENESLFTVTAPFNAILTVNGIEVTEEYLTEKIPATDANEFESETAPEIAVYGIKGLRYTPTVTAVMNGNELPVHESGEGEIVFAYPDSYKASYTAEVPKDVELYCNGKLVGGEYLSAELSGKYELPESVSKYAKPDSEYVTYTIGGFYGEPVFTTDSGNVKAVNDGVTRFYPTPSESLKDQIRREAQNFTELFMKYSYEGTDYTKANFDAVMAHVKEGSDAYDIIEVSYESMKYNSNFRIDKLETEIYDFIKYADGCYGVKVDFDSHGMYYKFEKVSVGTYTMIWIALDGEWLLADFIFT